MQPINTHNGLAVEKILQRKFSVCLDRRWLLWCYVEIRMCHFVCTNVIMSTRQLGSFCHFYYHLLSLVMICIRRMLFRSIDIRQKYSTLFFTVYNYLPLPLLTIMVLCNVTCDVVENKESRQIKFFFECQFISTLNKTLS